MRSSSVLVSKCAISDIALLENCETKTTLESKFLVSLDPEIRANRELKMMRISGSGH